MRKESTSNNYNDKFAKVSDKYDDTKDQLLDTADEVLAKGMAGAESARETFVNLTEKISSTVEDSVQNAMRKMKDTTQEAEKFVKKYPLYTVAGAVAVSLVAGIIYGKMSRK